MPRELTTEECRDILLTHIHDLVEYWVNEERRPDTRDKLNGLAFSILATLDGCTIGIPVLEVVPHPHPADAEYHSRNGENWWPSGVDLGCLHEFWHKGDPK